MDAERARATLAASLVNSWDSGAAHVEDNLATYLRESAWHPGTPSHDLGAFVTKWDRNAIAYSDSDVQVSDTDVKRFAWVWQSAYDTVLPRNEGVVARVRARLITRPQSKPDWIVCCTPKGRCRRSEPSPPTIHTDSRRCHAKLPRVVTADPGAPIAE
jgi:hypothetical protein